MRIVPGESEFRPSGVRKWDARRARSVCRAWSAGWLCLAILTVFPAWAGAAEHQGHGAGHAAVQQNHTDHAGHGAHEETNAPAMVPDGSVPGLDGHVHPDLQAVSGNAPPASVDEKLGDIIPPGIMFRDESGLMVDVRSLMDLPTIIAPVYFNCPSVCNILQSSIAKVLPQMSLVPEKDYRVLSVSFDETDTPDLAARRKANYLAAMNHAYPPEAWRFLTADKESIDRLMDAIGYRFTRVDKDFVHPIVVVAVSPEGKIVRYLYGNSFLPFDTAMALTEAAEGKVGLSLKRIVSYCFSYDPQGRRYVLDVMRIAGFVVLFGVAVLFFVLVRGGRKTRK